MKRGIFFLALMVVAITEARHVRKGNFRKRSKVEKISKKEGIPPNAVNDAGKRPKIWEINQKAGLKSDIKKNTRFDKNGKRYASTSALWFTNGRPQVPYVIASHVEDIHRQSILKYIKNFNAKFQTDCEGDIWIPRTNQDYYVSIQTNDQGCWSYVGRIEEIPQPLNLQPGGCVDYESTAHHEMLHAMGMNHEQTRRDRDVFVQIKYQNLPFNKDVRSNFEKESNTLLYTKYDYTSVMHYDSTAFSSNGKPTIVDVNGKIKNLGGHHMTEKDILEIKTLYKCKIEKMPCVIDIKNGQCDASKCPSGTSLSSSTSTCDCLNGGRYNLKTEKCEEKGEETNCVDTDCGENAQCSWSGKCECKSGYEPDENGSCVEENGGEGGGEEETECLDKDCPENAVCSWGGYCDCKSGYEYDDEDNCVEKSGRDVCHCTYDHEICIGGVCTCDQGYQRGGYGQCEELECPLGKYQDDNGKCRWNKVKKYFSMLSNKGTMTINMLQRAFDKAAKRIEEITTKLNAMPREKVVSYLADFRFEIQTFEELATLGSASGFVNLGEYQYKLNELKELLLNIEYY